MICEPLKTIPLLYSSFVYVIAVGVFAAVTTCVAVLVKAPYQLAIEAPDVPSIPLRPLVPAVPDDPLLPLVPDDPLLPDDPLVPVDPLVPAVADVPEVPLEPSPPLAPPKLIVHALYVPPPTVLKGAPKDKEPVAGL